MVSAQSRRERTEKVMDRLHRATPSISITLCENEIRELIDLLDNQRSQSPVSNSLSYKMRLALDRL